MSTFILRASVLVFLGLLTGCGSAQPRQADGRPAWVVDGAKVARGDGLFAASAVSHLGTSSIRKPTANAQARAQLARLVATGLREHLLNGPAEAAEWIDHLELTGVEIEDTHFDARTGTQFSLARLRAEAFAEQLANTQPPLGTEAKAALEAAAAQLFAATVTKSPAVTP